MLSIPIREVLIIFERINKQTNKKTKEMIKHIIRRHAPLIADVMFKYAFYIFIILRFEM